MQSIIIAGKDIQKVKDEAQKICSENNISKFDIDILQSEKSLGIGDIRELNKKIFLKPVESEKKAVILEAFSGITIEAQNAFLKLLEEPPINTIILILASSLDFVLPTVLSRCSVINSEKNKNLSQEEIETNTRIITSLRFSSNALIIAQDFSKDRETALNFLEKLIITLEESVENSVDYTPAELGKILRKLQETYTVIKTTNISPRFALENCFLNLF